MTRDNKYSHNERGCNRYDAATTLYGLVADEFERRVGRWQLNVLQNKFPAREATPEKDLIGLIETFNLATSENPELRETAAKLLAAHKPTEMKGMLVKFYDGTPHPEDAHSYRFYELLIFGDGNYVAVLTRKSWTVLTKDKVVKDSDGEPEVNDDFELIIRPDVKGEPYESGATQWCVRSYHDSCWRESIRDFFMQTPHLGHLNSLFDWYELLVIKEGDEVWQALRNRNELKPWHFDEDHNYIGEQHDET